MPRTLENSTTNTIPSEDTSALFTAIRDEIVELNELVFVDVTLSCHTSALDAGDVIATTQIVASAFQSVDGTSVLKSLLLIDEDDAGAALNVVFLSANSSLGTEGSAPDIDDTEVRDVLGVVAIATGDYVDLGTSRVATKTNIGLAVRAVTGTRDLYVGAINGAGAPTYTASGLKLRLGFLPS